MYIWYLLYSLLVTIKSIYGYFTQTQVSFNLKDLQGLSQAGGKKKRFIITAADKGSEGFEFRHAEIPIGQRHIFTSIFN